MKDLKEQVIHYNKQMKEALSLLYNELNQGQQKKIIKNNEVKDLLTRYGVISAD